MASLRYSPLTVLVLIAAACSALADDLNVPPEKIDGGPPGGMMHRYLERQVEQAIAQWRAAYEERKSPEQIAAYQKQMREKFLTAIGGLPEPTPLESRVVGTVSRPGYQVDKIIFESQPKHFVTALLFLPDANRFKPPYPGVIMPCGHASDGKGHKEYQTGAALLALNGMAALVFDPIDQGERGQYLGPGGWPKLWGTAAHTVVGMGCVLLGQNTARFEIWDGMRAIDYLQSRPEIDPTRIGCTGCSGGGTQTTYLMALDDRIAAAAPSCYVTSTPRLLEVYGTDDSEQQIFGQLLGGPFESDMVMMRAPSPVLILAATHDFFDIVGSWQTLRNAKRLFTRMGYAERVDIVENDAKHGYAQLQREGMARWMSRWLLGKDLPITEPEIDLLAEDEYRCTPDGKVMMLPGSRSVYDLNEDYENKLAVRRKASWTTGDRAALFDGVRHLTGIRILSDLPKPTVETVATIPRDGYAVEKLVIRPEPGICLPALLFLPAKPGQDRVVLHVHQQGKTAELAALEERAKNGVAILAVDLRGTGQTQSTTKGWGGPQHQDSYLAYMLGRSIVGMRAEDVLTSARYASERVTGGRPASIELEAVGNVGIPALHAAALEPALFHSVKLRGTLASWSNVIHSRLNRDQVTNFVHGALTHYDLPNLAATLGQKLSIEQPVDAMGALTRTQAP